MFHKSGTCDLPLHPGRAPRWLFSRMVKLGQAISEVIIYDYGPEDFLKRLSDPFFFQSFANVLAWDWHSSGATPVLCGALKQANLEELGVFIAGGKGKTSRKTPEDIERLGSEINLSNIKIEKLKYTSKLVAKIDNNLVQDQYFLYHHSFFFTENGKWCVIQQGMNIQNKYARRYHWLSDNVQTFIEEPHNAICCDITEEKVLNLTSKDSRETRKVSLDLVKDNPKHLEKYFIPNGQRTLKNYKVLVMGSNHYNLNLSKRSLKFLKQAYEFQPENYEELVALRGMGAETIRALALISELVYGSNPSYLDPAGYSHAFGGKDKIPRPVDKQLMDQNTEFLKEAIKKAKVGDKDRIHAIRRLSYFIR